MKKYNYKSGKYKNLIADYHNKGKFKNKIQIYLMKFWLKCKLIFWTSQMFNISFYVYLFYIAIIILGLFHTPFWYSLLLTYFVYMSTILNKVLYALAEPYQEIIQTFFLLFGLIYLFSIIYYISFHDTYPNNSCYSLFDCFFVNID